MAQATIALTGIPCQGRHGASPGEQLEVQAYTVDLELLVDFEGDSLEDTLDYRQVAGYAQTVVAETSFRLLESLAEEVGRRIFELPRVLQVTALVHKLHAAERMGIEDVAAEVSFEA